MLQLILGRAGAGKTTYVRQFLQEMVQNGEERRIFYIVPEQNSFESERAMLELLGEKDAGRVEVLSFTRLTDSVMREVGGMAGRRLDDCGRSLFMSMALEQVADRLEMYRRQVDREEFIEMALRTLSECKMSGVSPEDLQMAGVRTGNGSLQKKTEELALIFRAYEALVGQSFVDPQDDLKRLEEMLREHAFFAGAVVVLDAFKGFTAQEMRVMEQVMKQADEVYLTLCTDKEKDSEQPLGLFCTVQKTAAGFLRLARRNGIEVRSSVKLEGGRRFANPALRRLEEVLFRPGKGGEEILPQEIDITVAPQKYSEAEFVARTIRRLVREEGYRYRDFTVILRREEDYSGIIDEAMEKYGVPFFMDLPQEIEYKPLVAFLLGGMQAVQNYWNSEDVFRWLKTGMLGLTTEEIASLENYCFLWNISGKQWEKEWVSHPEGFAEEWREEDREHLAELNGLRERVMAPLRGLSRLRGVHTGLEFATGLYRFLEETDSAQRLRELAGEMAEKGWPQLAEEQLRLWEILMGILDQIVLVLRETPMEYKRFVRLFRLAVNTVKVSSIPQTLDQVLIGGADHVRPDEPKRVFLLGVNQGVFPAAVAGSGMFSDKERRALRDKGLELAADAEERAAEERFLAYNACFCASRGLSLSYVQASVSGEGMFPSELIEEVRRCVPRITVQWIKEPIGVEEMECEAQAFETMASTWEEETADAAVLRQYFRQAEGYAPSLQAMGRLAEALPMQFRQPEKAVELFGDRMRLSPSRVEKFHQCPFSYFCQYGVYAKVRRPARMDALEYGTLIHFLLEHLLKERAVGKQYTDPKELSRRVKELLEGYLQEKLGGEEGKSQRFLYLYRRFERTAVLLMTHLVRELEQSEFVPTDFELDIGDEVPAMELELPDGGSISVRGKIDRVDVMRKNGHAYVRVVDYKTGAKKFYLKDVVYGLNMQMLIYLITLWKNGGERYREEVLPAGVLYMPAISPKVEGVRGEENGDTTMRREAALKMNGMVLDDPEVIEGMERRVAGIFIPVKYKKDGTPDAHSQIFSLAQMGNLARYIGRLLVHMGEELHKGNIFEKPVEHACEYCDYGDVCGREADEPAESIPNRSNKEVFAFFAEEEKEEGTDGQNLDTGTEGRH